MIKSMAFVAYSVRDVPAAKRFYRDVLGLRPGGLDSDHWVEFDVGGATFGIGNGEPLGIIPGTSFSATFEVDDLSVTRASLLDQKIPVTDVHESPTCYSAFVTDPEGNRFGLHQNKTG